MTRIAGMFAALSLLAAAPANAVATEYLPVMTGPWQPSKPSARTQTPKDGPHGVVTTGPWTPSKPGARSNVPSSPPVVIMTGPWIPSKGPVRSAHHGE